MLARDVAPDRLYGCDPTAAVLDVCRSTGVPATFAHSDPLPERLPFGTRFDLCFAFSVFTHLSEAAHQRCLDALHDGMRPGGVLIVTVRPPAYLQESGLIAPARRPVAPGEAAYLFVAHPSEPDHPQFGGGEMTYGETVVTLPYVRERWGDRFELLTADLLLADMFQVVLTLRRR
jgi:SAM-dependent methyltransferase